MKKKIKKNKIKKEKKPFPHITRGALKTLFLDYFIIILGTFIYAFSVDYFIAPNHISAGGITGVSTLINYVTGFPIGVSTIIINIPLIFLAFKSFGMGMLIRTAVATFSTSVFIDALEPFITPYKSDNLLLAAIFGGAIGGIGLGLVFLRGGTTGGTDIIAKLIKKKKPHRSVGTNMLMCELFIMVAVLAVYKSIESVMFSVIVIFLMTKCIDYVVYGASQSKLIMIITDRKEQIVQRIFEDEESRGITLIPAKGAYTNTSKDVILTVVRPNEVIRVNKVVKDVDPNAFTIISDASEVYGDGFQKADN